MSTLPVEIFAEDVDFEQWQMLLRFGYPDNIQKFFSSKNYVVPDESIIETVAGSILQAHEYFVAAKNVTLNTSPLLYYYGITNLLYAVCTLLNGGRLDIEGHGMQLQVPENLTRIADLQVIPRWQESGAFRRFCEPLAGSLAVTGGESWTLLEIMGSVPELKSDLELCYSDAQPFVVPVETVKLKDYQLDRIALTNIERFTDKRAMLERIEGAASHYLPASQTGTYLILPYKLDASEIGTYSIAGQKFLQLSHNKGRCKITLPTIIYCFLGLYVLGFVSRYRPEIWTPFVRADSTGERQFIERFIHTARRIVPNLALNALYQSRFHFVTRLRGLVDLSSTLTSDEIKEIVRSEIVAS